MLFIISRAYETVWMEIMKMKTLSTYSGKSIRGVDIIQYQHSRVEGVVNCCEKCSKQTAESKAITGKNET